MDSIIPAFLFAAMGIFSIVAAITNWDWYFQTKNAELLTRFLHRTGARIFYGLLGAGLVWMAYDLYSLQLPA